MLLGELGNVSTTTTEQHNNRSHESVNSPLNPPLQQSLVQSRMMLMKRWHMVSISADTWCSLISTLLVKVALAEKRYHTPKQQPICPRNDSHTRRKRASESE